MGEKDTKKLNGIPMLFKNRILPIILPDVCGRFYIIRTLVLKLIL